MTTTTIWHYIESSELRDNAPMTINRTRRYAPEIMGELQHEISHNLRFDHTDNDITWVLVEDFTYDEITHFRIIGMIISNHALGANA